MIVTVALLLVIAGRYVGFATAWADEVARVAFMWSVALGGASGAYRGLNFAVPLVGTHLRGRPKAILESALALVVIVMCVILLWATTQSLPVAMLGKLPALGISGAWFHVAIVAFSVLTVLFMAIRLVESWRGAE
ncbi:MAG: TRAP transporter small permease [Burkholderiales bacterium]|nr:TRAP transporter small permease [Burkholderiales bacterium]